MPLSLIYGGGQILESPMKDAIGQQLHRIHMAAHLDPIDVNTIDEAVAEIGRLIEKVPMPVRDKENHKTQKRKAA